MHASYDPAIDFKPVLLCVDDEPNILRSLNRVLHSDYRIFTAGGGDEGLALLENEQIHIVISDMRMPHMDGAQFLETVQQRWPTTIRILLTGYSDMNSTINAINKGSIYRYISKPWEDNDLRMTIRNAAKSIFLELERERLNTLTLRQNDQLRELNVQLEAKVRERTAQLHRAMTDLEKSHETLKESYVTSVKVFANLIEFREGSLSGHSRRVAALARRLAQQLGLDQDEVQNVLFAGLLHDIGKISLPDTLLHKPYNALSAPDQAQVAKHPILGASLLMALQPLQTAAIYIKHHHERYDGTGYPERLQRKNIPLGARILAVVNDYDALQCGTLASQRMLASEAKEYLQRHSGTRYDPAVAGIFIDLLNDAQPVTAGTGSHQLRTDDLYPGMALAKDLVTKDDVLLLSEGYMLDEHLIEKIRGYERHTGERFEIHVKVRKG